jgi:hypothetical protein
MNKIEKYYSHIIDSVVSDTEYEINMINNVKLGFPWGEYVMTIPDIIDQIDSLDRISLDVMSKTIRDYFSGKYGLQDNEIASILQQSLKVIYQSIIDEFRYG